MADAGNAVELRRYPGAIHAFFQMGGSVEDGAAAVADAARVLGAAFLLERIAKQSRAPGIAHSETHQHNR